MAVDFDKDDLKALCPAARKDYLDALVASKQLLDDLDISDASKRFTPWVATIAHESGGLKLREESLNYTAKRLTKVWPGRFPTLAKAQPFANNPQKLANYTYDDANRDEKHKLGNTQPGDGWRFRGRGLIQITGRAEYERVGNLIGIDLVSDPDKAADPQIAVAIAAHLFVDKGCLKLCDKGDFRGVTKKINGGHIGLDDRVRYLMKAKAIFTDVAPRDAQPTKPSPSTPPGSIVQSTEANAAAFNSTAGGTVASIEIGNAMSKTMSDSSFSMAEFLLHLASSPWFWGGVIVAILGAYGVLRRRARLLQWGV